LVFLFDAIEKMRMNHLIFLNFFLLFAYASAGNDEAALENKLKQISGLSFKKISKPGDQYLKYELSIRQPLDHFLEDGKFFSQRVILTHKNFDSSTIMETQGYWLYERRNEIEKIFNANNLNIEYRYYGKSIPDSADWKYLTVEQASADLHYINAVFRKIYTGKWISTGTSKGGQACLFYKYFYPGDVDVTIPYVAPVNRSVQDTRIYDFLDTIGTDSCRKKIYDLQLFLLNHEKESIELLKKNHSALSYNYVGGIGPAFEYNVLEFPFSFWSNALSCEFIPDTGAVEDALTYLEKTVAINFWSDEVINKFSANYYQSATQTGYYGYNILPFKKHLNYFKENPSAIFPPKGLEINYTDCALTKSLKTWLEEKGNNIIYIYGALDTWSACRVNVSSKVNSKSFLIPEAGHKLARLLAMPDKMREEFSMFIKEFTGLIVNYSFLRKQ
jgi:hypothetical protein